MSSLAGKNRKSGEVSGPLTADITDLPGVGPGRRKLLTVLGIRTVADLLLYPPRRYIDRKAIVSTSDLAGGEIQTIVGEVRSVEVRRTGRKTLAVARVRDESGAVKCVWFNQPYLKNSLKRGESYLFSGQVRVDKFGTALVHPEYELEGGRLLHTGRVVPVYRLAPGLGQRFMRRLADAALESHLPGEVDPIPEELLGVLGLMPLSDALSALHFPEDLEQAERARRRLAFDEMLLFQTMFAKARMAARDGQGRSSRARRGGSHGHEELVSTLPFDLTPSQDGVLREVLADLEATGPMRRLIQGDVGCGKTVVAGLAAARVCGSGDQVALMCPTELLAEQHYRSMAGALDAFGHSVGLLTGGMTAAERSRVLAGLASGRIDMVVGTHALFSERVEFRRLGLVVVDEEQRFGVLQRGRLVAKAPEADFLALSATPIPRTLALTAYGDLDISVIDELPPGRGRHVTKLVLPEDRESALAAFTSRIGAGEQAFYICPVLDDGSLGLTGVKTAKREIEARLGSRGSVGLITGRTPSEERQETVRAFEAGKVRCIVATSVLEVGIDVPGATLLVVQEADRFGLSQLHQMRGRVQRSSRDSYSYFLVPETAGERAMRRLAVLEDNYDGFDIAEQDLMLRGPGDIVGRRQHGLPGLRFTMLPEDMDLLHAAREAAFRAARAGGAAWDSWLEVIGGAAGGDRAIV